VHCDKANDAVPAILAMSLKKSPSTAVVPALATGGLQANSNSSNSLLSPTAGTAKGGASPLSSPHSTSPTSGFANSQKSARDAPLKSARGKYINNYRSDIEYCYRL